MLKCSSRIYHGPGHQSGTYCQLTGKHNIHEAYYGEFNQFGRWKGEENFSGVFDEPPPDPVEEAEAYESLQKRREEIRKEIEAEQHTRNIRKQRIKQIESWLSKIDDTQLFELEKFIEMHKALSG